MSMEFMLSVVSPIVLPALEKSLQAAFVTGFATSWKLSAAANSHAKAPSLALPNRGRYRRLSSKHEEDRPKAPPNDPQRQGNIWQRYEQLERSAKSLADVNQQMALEKAKHQRDKKRLEEEVLELQRVNASLMDAASGHDATCKEGSPPIHSSTAESATSLSEGGSEQRSHRLLSSPPLPAAPQPDKEEDNGSATAKQAEAMTLLQKQPGDSQEHAEDGSISLKAEFEQLRGKLATQTQDLALQVKALTAENDTLRSQVAKQRSAQAGELRNVELVQCELNGRLEDLAEEKKLLREQLAKANLTAASQPDAAMLRSLAEQNKALTLRNAHLEDEVASGSHNRRLHETDQAMADVHSENARLQAKIMRLSSSASAVASAQELLEQLKKENAMLLADNERLLSHVEGLESTGTGSASAGTSRNHRKLLENFVQLKVDNKVLTEESARLASHLAEVQHARGNITTVPVPVRVEDGQEVDRELWVLLEEVQERNQALAAENTALRARTPTGAWNASEAELAIENERLHRQLAAVMELRTAELNEDNLYLINYLTEENLKLEQENQRVITMLAASAKSENRGVIKDILSNLERLQRDKAKALADNADLAKRNTRLIEESEALLMRCQAGSDAQSPSAPALKKGRKGLFPFRKATSKSVLPVHLSDSDSPAVGQDSPKSQASSGSSLPAKGGATGAEALPLECAHLRQENSRLLAENRQLSEQASMVPGLTDSNASLAAENTRLNDRMAKLVKDLTEENTHLLSENQRLNETMQKVLSENAELSSRLIELALTSDNDVFNAAFGNDHGVAHATEDSTAVAPMGYWSQEAAQKRRKEAEDEIREVGRQQAMRQQQRKELSHRASAELKAYEQATSSAESAYSKSKALALQRLNSRNSQLLRSGGGGAPSPASHAASAPGASAPGAAALPTPEQEDDRSTFTDDGGFEEAGRRRKEAELSRAQLQQKIESLKQARNSVPRADEGAARTKSASLQRAKAEAAHRKVMARKEAESTVRASYFRFAGNSDVASFMRWLGYDMPASKDASPPALFRAAVQVAQRSRRQSMSQDKQMLAEATITKLQEWLSQIQKDPPVES